MVNTHFQLMNLNDHILFIPSEFGIETLKSIYSKMDNYKPEDNRYIKMQMWEFMNIFGQYLYNGSLMHPVQNMNVYVEVKNEHTELKTFSI